MSGRSRRLTIHHLCILQGVGYLLDGLHLRMLIQKDPVLALAHGDLSESDEGVSLQTHAHLI